MGLEIRPLVVDRKSEWFSLFDDLVLALEKNRVKIENGDVLAVSSKYIANSQGRVIGLEGVRTYPGGEEIARRFHIPERFAEVILRESDSVLGGIAGFVMSAVDSVLAPNAGIDRSNSKKDQVVLYPNSPYEVAEDLKRRIFLKFLVNVGVIVIDSRLMPARVGTVGVAIGCSGIEPVNDMRSQKDLDGNPLKVTMQATADSLATAANHSMGEGSESRPYVVIKKSDAMLTARRIRPGEVAVAHDQCVYVRSLKKQSSFK